VDVFYVGLARDAEVHPYDDNNVVFAAHQHARWSIETIRRRQLTTRNLDEEICPWICRLAPFTYNMIQTQVEFVVCQHLWILISFACSE